MPLTSCAPPLASVQGYAELYRHGAKDNPDDLAPVMDRIDFEAARMSVLVDELLLLARLDAGRPLERAFVNLSALVGEAVDAVRVRHPERDIACEGGDSIVARGDAVRLRQVLDNLLANACLHTPADSPVRVTLSANQDQAVMKVADSGPGIPPELRERVFDRFYRGGRSDQDGGHGSGLGLAIVAAVVDAHGGHVGVADSDSGGAVFTVDLPTTPHRSADACGESGGRGLGADDIGTGPR